MLSPSVNRGMRSGNPGTASGMMVPRFRNAERNMEAVAQNAWRVPAEQHGKIQVEGAGAYIVTSDAIPLDDAVSVEGLGVYVTTVDSFLQDDAVSVEGLVMYIATQDSYPLTVDDDAVSVEGLGVYIVTMET